MSDDFDRLRQAMDRMTPDPDPPKRDRDLDLALKNFDDMQKSFQGSHDAARPTPDSAPKGGGLIQGVFRMFAEIGTRRALVGTTSLVAASLALFVVLPLVDDTGRTDFRESAPMLEISADAPAQAGSQGGAPGPVNTDSVIAESAPVALNAPVVTGMISKAAPQAGQTAAAPPAQDQSLYSRGLARIAETPPTLPRPVPSDTQSALQSDTETFANAAANPVKVTAQDPVSTFSIDVDTASYAIVRASLMAGYLPPRDAVRIEEMVNYFPYSAPAPDGDTPFRPTVSLVQTPWNPDTQLVHIALQGQMPALDERPPLNLVFLIDTSGSMQGGDKLPLLVQSFRMMLGELRAEDQVAIVAYAGSAGLVLDPTPASDRTKIMDALNALSAGGSTAGQAGLQQAYRVARDMTGDGEISRVILATDGDFNVGLSDPDALKDFIADQRDSGTYLSVLGFGRGNLDDATMQALAQNGNGRASYIDTLSEARKVLVDELTGALFPIANDVKIQVEFNPATVAEYRLIGYETRALAREDFTNDRVDAGDIGAGHAVTALYEVTPVGSPAVLNSPLRYAETPATRDTADTGGELGFLRLRYKAPGEDTSRLVETPIANALGVASDDVRFSSAIAGFGQLLREDKYLAGWTYDDAITLASGARGDDPFGYRAEAVSLMRLAETMDRND